MLGPPRRWAVTKVIFGTTVCSLPPAPSKKSVRHQSCSRRHRSLAPPVCHQGYSQHHHFARCPQSLGTTVCSLPLVARHTCCCPSGSQFIILGTSCAQKPCRSRVKLNPSQCFERVHPINQSSAWILRRGSCPCQTKEMTLSIFVLDRRILACLLEISAVLVECGSDLKFL